MSAQQPTILDDSDIPLCDDCVEKATSFMRAMMDAWQDMNYSDEIFCFFVLMLADLIRFEEVLNPQKLDAEYTRYIGRKLQSIGAAIAGDVN